jgi:PAS domain S-box-containing protein
MRQTQQMSQEDEGRYRRIVERLTEGIWVIDRDARTTFVNPSMADMLGYRAEEMLGRHLFAFMDEAGVEAARRLLARRERGIQEQHAFEFVRKDGTRVHARLEAAPLTDQNGEYAGALAAVMDVSESRKSEEALRQSEEHFRRTFDQSPIGAAIVSLDFRHLRVNAELCRITGYSEEELLDMRLTDIIHPDDLPHDLDQARRMVGGEIDHYQTDNRYLRKDGRPVWVRLSVRMMRDASGRPLYFLPMMQDITERKQFEEYQTLTARLLEQLNRPGRGTEPLATVTRLIRDAAGIEAVGIRLNEGQDFPYFVTAGFPGEFVQAENHLCAHTDSGELILDEHGKPLLECMCGNVLSGRTDPSKPFFTEGGSFWTNSTTELLASTREQGRGGHTRDRCNRAGYESVALVPIRADDEIVGLLQLNDRRRGRFTPTVIRFFEQIGASIGIAIRRHRTEEALAESEERFRRIAETIQDVFWMSTPGITKMIYVSPAYERVWGRSRESLYARPQSFLDAVHPEDRDRLAAGVQEHAHGRWDFEYRIIRPDGSIRWIRDRGFPIHDEEGKLLRMTGVATDITERKQAEEALRAARDGLNRRVRERTAELSKAIEELQGEVRDRMQTEAALRQTNELLERMFAGIHLLVAYMDRDFNFIRVNRKYAEADERDPEFFVGKNHFDLYPNEENEAIFRRAVEDGKPFYVFAKPFVYPENPERGVTYWDWSLQPVHDADGRVSGLVLSLLDVTERERSKRAVETERKRLFSVLNILPGWVSLHARDHSIRFANDKFLELFGEPHNLPCYKVLQDRDAPCELCPAAPVLESRAPAEWEWTSRSGNTYHVWGYPFADVDGRRLVLQLGVDITERKQLETQLLRISEVERRRIGRDLHDSLGQTLSGLSCLSQVLHRRLAARSLPEAEDAARIESLLADSVALARSLVRGLNPVGTKPDSLMLAMRELAASVESMFGVKCLFQCDRPVFVADSATAMHLYRIAQEAANNAVRHGRAGKVTMTLGASDGAVVLTVADDGVGLPEELTGGDGMGLRIMQHRANTIGANLRIQRGRDGGTEIVCRLPTPPGQGDEDGE